MPEPIEELFVSIGADVSKLLNDTKKGVGEAETRLNKFSRVGRKAFNRVGVAVKSFTRLVGVAAAGLAGLAVTVNKLTSAYIKQQKAEAQLEATLRSTNNAVGIQSDELKKMASDLQKVTNIGDEVTLTAQAMLLTFTNIGRETFPRATEAVLDVATAMNSGATPGAEQLRTTAIQLGKSLNDPIKGLEGLQRVGIQFTESQKEQIKTLAESGQVAEAQARILAELERQFGGSARAARAADQGFEAAANTIGDLQEKIGRELIPLREGYIEFLKSLASEGEESSGIVTSALAGIAAVAGTVVVAVTAMVNAAKAQFSVLSAAANAVLNFEDPIAAARAASEEAGKTLANSANILGNLPDITRQAFNDIKAGWEEQRQAAEDAAAAGAAPAKAVMDGITDDLSELSEEQAEILRDAGLDLLDLQAETNAELEELAMDHKQAMAEIETEGAKQRLEINQKFDKELTDSQADIFKQASEDLKRLEQDTDRQIERRRKDANRDELRETEDHLTDMRRLRLSFLDDLEDAVKSRDAGRVRDLQRQFARESQERQQDFQKKQGRERSDTQQEIAELTATEERRAQEIINRRTEALAEVEQRVRENRDRELAALDEKLAAEKEKENTRFMERQTELENALQARLETLAKELSDMEGLEAESAQRILETLNEYFGVGGNIDQLMNDFASRRQQTLTLEIGFEERMKKAAPTFSPANAGFTGNIPAFQHGGSMIARKPTLAMFGEAGAEVATFTPISKMGARGGGQPQRIEIEMSGSAPPGIRSGDRDAIAGVVVNALREAGVNVRRGR